MAHQYQGSLMTLISGQDCRQQQFAMKEADIGQLQ